MKSFLDRFILSIPYLFLKQVPYAWFAVILLWTWPPLVSGIFVLIIIVGLLMMKWQSNAWMSNLRREYGFEDGKFYVDQPTVPFQSSTRPLIYLFLSSALVAWLLRGQWGVNFWQFFLIFIGFTVLYRDTQFFGRPTTYIITDRGIGIRYIPGHIDYRLFLPFREISRIERANYKKSLDTDLFARRRDVKQGLLMIPKDPKGFTRRIDKLFIAPEDTEKFMEQLPYGYG